MSVKDILILGVGGGATNCKRERTDLQRAIDPTEHGYPSKEYPIGFRTPCSLVAEQPTVYALFKERIANHPSAKGDRWMNSDLLLNQVCFQHSLQFRTYLVPQQRLEQTHIYGLRSVRIL